jgi:hypothetical protein
VLTRNQSEMEFTCRLLHTKQHTEQWTLVTHRYEQGYSYTDCRHDTYTTARHFSRLCDQVCSSVSKSGATVIQTTDTTRTPLQGISVGYVIKSVAQFPNLSTRSATITAAKMESGLYRS